MMRKKIWLTLLAVGSVLALGGCGKQGESAQKQSREIPVVQKDIFAMDTYMSVTGYGERAEEAVAASLQEITRLDKMLSVGNPDSEISVINSEGTGSISRETAVMVEKALEVGERTGGKFDITIFPLMVEWGFTSGEFRVPEQERLQELLEQVDFHQVDFDSEQGTVTLEAGQGMDLGGIAKGYTSDRIMELFREYGLVSGVVTLGGNVECFGTKTDGSYWNCGIRDPFDESELLGAVAVKDSAVITSGAYERNFTDEKTGQIYHHIIDPATGYPADSGLVSVTIVSKSGLLADALSTALYILGEEKAVEYWRQYGDEFDMVLMTEDKRVVVTEGIAERFTSDYEVIIAGAED
ncbi:MAG: FAD:protein FMN transferase [Lachnospiraceae bacterium]|nr:FAD:protein FMN transferase [Lachnospiraceae bacterium]